MPGILCWPERDSTDGRSPTTPQKAAGLRNDPPMSLPSAMQSISVDNAAAAPPLLPPTVLVRSHGFRVAPKIGLKVLQPVANSGIFVLPIMIAPEDFIRSTTSPSC